MRLSGLVRLEWFREQNPLSDLFACVERVSRGEIWAIKSHCEFLLETLRSAPSCEGIDAGKIGLLSKREFQVAECAAQGHSNKQIADQLGLSEHTVKNYLFRIFEKLGVSNRFELLFLLFKECNTQTNRAKLPFGTEIGHPIETYLKAADSAPSASDEWILAANRTQPLIYGAIINAARRDGITPWDYS